MQMLKKITTIILFTTLIFDVFSQKNNLNYGNIKGQVKDSTSSSPIEFSQVTLFKSIDSSVVSQQFSDDKGSFYLDEIELGKYFMKISFLGFDSKVIRDINLSDNKKQWDLGSVFLTNLSSSELEVVRITAKQDFLKNGIDKKVYNVDQDLSSKGSGATDVLNNIPSVDVDQDGGVSLRGDANVTVLIDGRLSSISGSNGNSLLETIPAGSIERIEVVTNPSAKYSPDGTSGIINIVLKKNKLRGTNYLISSSIANGPLFNGSASMSYRDEKKNLFINYSNLYKDGYRNFDGQFIQKDNGATTSILDQVREGADQRSSNTLRFGSDFYLKNNQTFGVVFSGTQSSRVRTGNLVNSTLNPNYSISEIWTRNSRDPINNLNFDIASNYSIELKKDKGKITVDANYSRGDRDFQGEYQEVYYNVDGSLRGIENLDQRIGNDEQNSNSTFQADYTTNIKKWNVLFETGVKAIVRTLDVDASSEERDTLSNNYVIDELSNFTYKYDEQVYAGYVTLGQKRGKFKYQAGLRAEQAYQLPYLVSEDLKFTNEYFELYPSGHLKYEPKEKQEISLSYSRRINRPRSSQMNPFSNFSDPFNLRKGNPDLKPEFIDSYDFAYSIDKNKLNITTSLYYRYTTNVIQRLREYYSDNTSAVVFSNINESQSIGFEFILGYKPFKWFRNTLSINGNTIRYKDPSIEITGDQNRLNWGLKYMGAVDFWKKTMSIQVNVNYFAPRFVPQGMIQRLGGVNISTEKRLNDSWLIGLRVTDIFDKQGFILDLSQESVDQTANYKWLSRRVYFNVVYKFGKVETSKAKMNQESGGGGDF